MQPIEDRTTLSQRLRLLRVASGMKQEDVAVQLGIGRSAYTYYELSRSKPDYDTPTSRTDRTARPALPTVRRKATL